MSVSVEEGGGQAGSLTVPTEQFYSPLLMRASVGEIDSMSRTGCTVSLRAGQEECWLVGA